MKTAALFIGTGLAFASLSTVLPSVAFAQSTPAAPQPAKVANPPMPPGAQSNGSAVSERDRPANTTPPSASTEPPPKPAGK